MLHPQLSLNSTSAAAFISWVANQETHSQVLGLVNQHFMILNLSAVLSLSLWFLSLPVVLLTAVTVYFTCLLPCE